jgi:hypothetical protein
MPCLTLFLLFSDRLGPNGKRDISDRDSAAIEFIKGFFYAVPALVVMFLVRRYVPLSYRNFSLYFLFLIADHLIPVAALAVLYFPAYSHKGYASLISFGGGFYTLVGIVEVLTNYGQFESYHLFLLPLIRMGGLLFFTIFFLRFEEWYGLVRVLFAVLLAAVPFLSGALTFLYMKSYFLWATALGVLFFLGSLAYTYIERKG